MAAQDGFTALVLEETDGKVTSSIQSLDDSDLPDGDVTVAVDYSTLNYKDGMIIKGLGKIVRTYPHVPGIDFAGSVIKSASPKFKPGDQVVLNGFRVGELHWGGLATKARVQADWLLPLPDGMTPRQAMAIGTAGYTAMLGVMALEDHGLIPDADGEVLVTGAAGGVGSAAVAILANLGYRVAASTGRAETHDYLRDLGATTIIERTELETPPKGPLGSARWSGVIDNVGGSTLAHRSRHHGPMEQLRGNWPCRRSRAEHLGHALSAAWPQPSGYRVQYLPHGASDKGLGAAGPGIACCQARSNDHRGAIGRGSRTGRQNPPGPSAGTHCDRRQRLTWTSSRAPSRSASPKLDARAIPETE